MEAELLRDMVTDRDKRIDKIKLKTEDLRLRAIVISSHLERVGAEVAEQSTAFTSEKSKLVHLKESVMERLEQTQKDFKQQGVSLQTYSRDAVQGGNDSSYVMRMQAQLCKAMHSLGITDHQMELVEKHSESDAKFHKEILATCTEERTATELELMNQLILKDNERRDFESVFTTQLEKIAKEREAIERQIEENSEDEGENDEDEEHEEEDPEEKETKEELMKLLTERRDEIERLEQLQEEQDDLIAELEDQVSYDDDGRAAVIASTATSTLSLGGNVSAGDTDDQDVDNNDAQEDDDDNNDAQDDDVDDNDAQDDDVDDNDAQDDNDDNNDAQDDGDDDNDAQDDDDNDNDGQDDNGDQEDINDDSDDQEDIISDNGDGKGNPAVDENEQGLDEDSEADVVQHDKKPTEDAMRRTDAEP